MTLLRSALAAAVVSALAMVGCGGSKSSFDAATGQIDAGVPDALVANAPPGVEIMSGAGRLTGGNMTMDVQIGHPISQQPASGGNTTVEGNATIKP